MSEHSSSFIEKSKEKAVDRDHRGKINFNIAKYNAVVPIGKQQYINVHLAREIAKNLKWKAIEDLDKQLEKFETEISKRGVKVIWAETAEQAFQ